VQLLLVDALDERDAKRSGLTSTCLRLADNVVPVE
jgi:hypothetical protein